jgi:hypothetical protein
MEKITANELESFRPYHPGELLKDELEYNPQDCRRTLNR